ncbi:CHASE3 domain-containing protein [Sphingomonas sp. TX0543]|uniref:CHASE3 domain-containing protein n=1 Tax=Sphingomonadales TaxID=204457 RepID=UPI00147645A5|nr:CHASE3 domain-containing protein [Sphingomonas fennica]
MLLAIGAVTLALLLMGAFYLSEQQRRSEEWVRHTLSVENRITQLWSSIQSAETQQRAYLITRKSGYLDNFRTSLQAIATQQSELAEITSDNPIQRRAMAKLKPQLAGRIDALNLGLTKLNAAGFAAAAEHTASGTGTAYMEGAKAALGEMSAEENRLLSERQRSAARQRSGLQIALGVGFVGLIALMAYALRDASARYQALEQSRDHLDNAYGVLRDEVTHREQIEAQLRQLHKMEAIGQLTGGIAHDFNNMLSVIMGSIELAMRRLTSKPDKAADALRTAQEGAKRAASLTARLLAFARQTPLEPSVVDPNKLVINMSELLRRTIGEPVAIETVLTGGVWHTEIDAHQLENAILNLCVNARDAMPDGGKLTIETSNAFLDENYAAAHTEVTAGQYVLVSITDNGSGMPPEVIEKAFDPFFTTKGVGKGTGLGLSQVFGFVKQSGGHIKIYSEIGQGTSVKLYLRRSFARPESQETSAFDAESYQAPFDALILLVEDDDQVRNLTHEILLELGYRVAIAVNGGEALEKLASLDRVDVLLTDIVMPGMSGRELADKAQADHGAIRVLYMTGYTRNAIVHNGVVDAGVNFIQKPFGPDQLGRRLVEVLRKDP